MKLLLGQVIVVAAFLSVTSTTATAQSKWQAEVLNGKLAIASVLQDDNVLVAVTCKGTLMYGSGDTSDFRQQKVEIDGQDMVWVVAGEGEAGIVYSANSAGIRQLKRGYTIKFINGNGVTHRFDLTGFTRAYKNAC